MTKAKRNLRINRVKAKPHHEKLPWPGLRAKDHLTRVVTGAVKEAKEIRENEAWAECQIARVLDFVSPGTAMRLLCRAAERRKNPVT